MTKRIYDNWLRVLLLCTLAGCTAEYDIVLQGGWVVDGTNTPPKQLTVAIRNGRIGYVGPLVDLDSEKVVDVTGLVVSPGFIDVHNHSELHVLSDLPFEGGDLVNEAYIRQGVTLVVIGADGLMGAEHIREVREYVGKFGSSTNIAAYVGHNIVRKNVLGDAHGLATPAEIEAMKVQIREGMELGAVGFSTGLMYTPGMYSNTDEVIELAKVVAPYGGTYDSHDRDPVFDLIGSVQEVIEVGRRAGIPAKVAHAKIVGRHNQGKWAEFRSVINEARSRGQNVVTDQYPYDGAATSELFAVFALPESLMPDDWDPEGGVPPPHDWMAALLSDAHKREEIRLFNEQTSTGFTWVKAVGYSSFRIVTCPQRPELVGRHIIDLAKEQGIPEFDLIANLITEPGLEVTITVGAVDEKDVEDLMIQPWNMIASDGAWSESEQSRLTHPRSTGTFTRVLGRYVRDLGVLDLSTAIHKMSGFPANFMGFSERGRIQEGFVADIVVFDPLQVQDRSDWSHPGRYSVGMVSVIVNGTFVLEDGTMTGKLPGTFVPLSRH